METLHGQFFKKIGHFWGNLRRFCYYNRTIFELIFIFLYAFEQIGLIWFTFNIKNSESLVLIVSIFAVIVLTTFALHKVIMESRIKLLEDDVTELFHEKLNLESITRQIINNYNELSYILKKSPEHLNKQKLYFNNKERKK